MNAITKGLLGGLLGPGFLLGESIYSRLTGGNALYPGANVITMAPPPRLGPYNVTTAIRQPGLGRQSGVWIAPPGRPFPGMDNIPYVKRVATGIKGPPKIPYTEKPKPKPDVDKPLPNCEGAIVKVSIITAMVDGELVHNFHLGSTPMDDTAWVV